MATVAQKPDVAHCFVFMAVTELWRGLKVNKLFNVGAGAKPVITPCHVKPPPSFMLPLCCLSVQSMSTC